MSKTWDERPQNLKGAELLAWALTTVADAIDNYNPSDFAIERAIDGLGAAVSEVGITQSYDRTPALQYVADRVGGNLERIADCLEAKQRLEELP